MTLDIRRLSSLGAFKALRILPLFLLLSCENVSCPLETTVESVYGFYASDRDADGVFYPGSAIAIADTLTITDISLGSVLVNRLVGQSSVKMPVSYYAEADSFEFCFTDTTGRFVYDAIYISKYSHPHWDDPSCPVKMWHEITGVTSTHHVIDTIIISNPYVNYEGKENLQIYFRTSN